MQIHLDGGRKEPIPTAVEGTTGTRSRDSKECGGGKGLREETGKLTVVGLARGLHSDVLGMASVSYGVGAGWSTALCYRRATQI